MRSGKTAAYKTDLPSLVERYFCDYLINEMLVLRLYPATETPSVCSCDSVSNSLESRPPR